MSPPRSSSLSARQLTRSDSPGDDGHSPDDEDNGAGGSSTSNLGAAANLPSDPKARRRERNRLAASAFRSRKKERLEVLEGRLGTLEGENRGLRGEVDRLRVVLKELGAAAAMSGLGVVPTGYEGLLVMPRAPGEALPQAAHLAPPPPPLADLQRPADEPITTSVSSSLGSGAGAGGGARGGKKRTARAATKKPKIEEHDDDDEACESSNLVVDSELLSHPSTTSFDGNGQIAPPDPHLSAVPTTSVTNVVPSTANATAPLPDSVAAAKQEQQDWSLEPPSPPRAPHASSSSSSSLAPPHKRNRPASPPPNLAASGALAGKAVPRTVTPSRTAPNQPLHLRRLPSSSSLLRTSVVANSTSDGDSSPDILGDPLGTSSTSNGRTSSARQSYENVRLCFPMSSTVESLCRLVPHEIRLTGSLSSSNPPPASRSPHRRSPSPYLSRQEAATLPPVAALPSPPVAASFPARPSTPSAGTVSVAITIRARHSGWAWVSPSAMFGARRVLAWRGAGSAGAGSDAAVFLPLPHRLLRVYVCLFSSFSFPSFLPLLFFSLVIISLSL